ncbi:MAG: metal-dependent hydrolase [Dehalococcoidia bacterium]
MLPLGHLTCALLLSDAVDGDPLAAAACSQLPDLVDKPLAWVFKATKSSRYLVHNLAAGGVLTALAYKFGGSRVARGAASGHFSHLLADQTFGGKIPFLWPFKSYRLGHSKFRFYLKPLIAEALAAAYLAHRFRLIESRGEPVSTGHAAG